MEIVLAQQVGYGISVSLCPLSLKHLRGIAVHAFAFRFDPADDLCLCCVSQSHMPETNRINHTLSSDTCDILNMFEKSIRSTYICC